MKGSVALILAAVVGLASCGDKQEQPAAASASPEAPAVPAPAPGEFDAAGTEPFWALKVRSDSLVLSRAGQGDVTAPAPKAEALGETLVWWAEGMSVSIMTRACNNGMSDRQYPYTAEVRIGDDILSGCAAKAAETTN